MKRILIVCLLILFGAIDLSAQFPISATVAWTPNAPTDNVTSYQVVFNNGTPINVDPSTCSPTECSVKITVASLTNTVVVTAVNMWGSASSTLNFTAAAPGRAGNLKIRVP